MYKVLLVDDERIILDGISSIIDWNALGTELIGTARNGLEAYESIDRLFPDIVISDIRMPGMDGLALVEKSKEANPSIEFIILSGFGEFEYAKRAMQFGVKHFLLKPCNEQTIKQALAETVSELDGRNRKEAFVQNLQSELVKVLPSAKEQFLKELVTNKMYGNREWEHYRSLFRISHENRTVRLLLCQMEGEFEFEHLFALKNIAEDILTRELLILSTTIGNHVLLLIQETLDEESLLERLKLTKETFYGYYRLDVTIAVSNPGDITAARLMYADTLRCLKHRFYLGEGSIITVNDIAEASDGSGTSFLYDDGPLCMMLKTGHWEEARQELEDVFRALSELHLDVETAKSYGIQLYMAIIRQGDPNRLNEYLNGAARLAELNTVQAIREYMEATAYRICTANFETQKNKHSGIIAKVLDIVDAHIGNPGLSLQWVAGEILYMNADYLGKLFKKETGEKFSNYVMKTRVEKAKQRILLSDDVRVFELAELFGFGNNPQYFSQVFKKYTGVTPSEFKRSP